MELHREVGGHQALAARVPEGREGLAQRAAELVLDAVQQVAGLHQLRVVVRGALGAQLVDDVANRLELLGGVEQGVEVALAGQEADAVLVVEVVVECGEVGVEPLGVGGGDDQDGLVLGDLDLVHGGKGLDALVAPAVFGLEEFAQSLADLLVRLVVEIALRRGAQAGDQVLHVPDEETPVAPGVQVPGAGDQAVDDLVLEPGQVAAGGAEVGDQLGDGQAAGAAGDRGERGDQEQLHRVLGVAAAQVGVQDLGDRLAAGGDVVGDGGLQAVVDLADLGEGLAVVQIQVVGADQVDPLGRSAG